MKFDLSKLPPDSARAVETLIRELGPDVPITLHDGRTYLVPRAYIALHGLKAEKLPILAEVYGWPQVPKP